MTWFRVDDTLAFHRKTVAAGNAAMGLWVRAGSWCAQQLTDGFVPTEIATTLGTAPQITRLVRARLWAEVEGGYTFHQWGEEGRQPTRDEVETRRERQRDRQRLHRERAANAGRITAESSDKDAPFFATSQVSGPGHTSVTDPADAYPTRPDPTHTQETPRGAAEEVSPDHARAGVSPHGEPPPASFPDPHPGRAVSGPSAADAYRFVDAAIGRSHPHAVRTDLAIQVGEQLLAGMSRRYIFAALTLWLEKPHLSPKALPSLISEAIRMESKQAKKTRTIASETVDAEIDAAFAAFTNTTNGTHLRALPRGA